MAVELTVTVMMRDRAAAELLIDDLTEDYDIINIEVEEV